MRYFLLLNNMNYQYWNSCIYFEALRLDLINFKNFTRNTRKKYPDFSRLEFNFPGIFSAFFNFTIVGALKGGDFIEAEKV